MKNVTPRSLQLWPAGTTVQVAGETHGGELRVKFRDSKRWRKATAEEKRAIEIEERAERYVENEILCNDSSLVTDAIRERGERGDFGKEWEWENVKNLRPNSSEMDLEECREYLRVHGHDEPEEANPWKMDRAAVIEAAHWGDKPDDDDLKLQASGTDEELRAKLIEDINEEYVGGLEKWREAVEENAEEAEVYQWFRVTEWFAKQLDSIGEVVLDNAYGCWWGRQCCGQSIIMDGTMQKIAERHSWI